MSDSYAPATGFPDWHSPDTPPPTEGPDAARPVKWLLLAKNGLYVSANPVGAKRMGWIFADGPPIIKETDRR